MKHTGRVFWGFKGIDAERGRVGAFQDPKLYDAFGKLNARDQKQAALYFEEGRKAARREMNKEAEAAKVEAAGGSSSEVVSEKIEKPSSKIITPEYLLGLRDVYEQNERRAREMAVRENDDSEIKRFLDAEIKARGMKEAIEELIFVMTGKFPELR